MSLVAHKNRAHSRFGASSAHRWMACPGSVAATADIEDKPTAAALEGTQAHELLEGWLLSEPGDLDFIALWRAATGEMCEAVQVAVDYVEDLLEEYPDAILQVEKRFEIPVAVAPGEVFGTNDVCIFVPSLRLLYVIDFKYGAGIFVDVRGNKQLRFYALGALAAFKSDPATAAWEFDTVALVIIQPRIEWAEPIREEWIPVTDVLAFANDIGAAIIAAKQPDAPLVPGPAQCQWCAIRVSCPAREGLALAAVGEHFGDIREVAARPEALLVVKEITADRLSELLAAKAAIVAWLNEVEKEAVARLRAGEKVPGHKLVEATGRRRWEGDEGEIAGILATIGNRPAQDFCVLKLRGLGEVETLLKEATGGGLSKSEAAAAKKAALEQMALLTTKRSSGNLVLAAESDPRPAAHNAGSAFGEVVQIPHVMNDGE
jgi:hypothetical protein